jgi:hypothetical protein
MLAVRPVMSSMTHISFNRLRPGSTNWFDSRGAAKSLSITAAMVSVLIN